MSGSEKNPKYVSLKESVFTPIEEVLIATGRGLAQAQKELDLASIEIQKEIDSTEALAGTGVEATWYAIPEAELNLKMTISVEEKKSTSGSSRGPARGKLLITPVNAKFQNQFNFSQQVASELRVKIVPVPKPTGATKTVPDVIGMTKDDGKSLLEGSNFKYELVKVEGTVKEGQTSEIKKLTPDAGTVVSRDYDQKVKVEYAEK